MFSTGLLGITETLNVAVAIGFDLQEAEQRGCRRWVGDDGDVVGTNMLQACVCICVCVYVYERDLLHIILFFSSF